MKLGAVEAAQQGGTPDSGQRGDTSDPRAPAPFEDEHDELEERVKAMPAVVWFDESDRRL